MHAQITRIQIPKLIPTIDEQEFNTIVGLVHQLLSKQELLTSPEDQELLREAIYAHIILDKVGATVAQAKHIAAIRKKVNELKVDYAKNKGAIATSLSQLTTMPEEARSHYQQGIKKLQALVSSNEDDFRAHYTLAEFLVASERTALPYSRMTAEQRKAYDQAISQCFHIVQRASSLDPKNAFLFLARKLQCRLYKQLYPSHAADKIGLLFAVAETETQGCLNRAHGYESGLLCADDKPDYTRATQELEQAHELDPSDDDIYKELIVSKSKAGCTLDEFEQKCIDSLTTIAETIAKKDLHKMTYVERLELYPMLQLSDDGLRFYAGPDKDGNQQVFELKQDNISSSSCSS